MGARASCGRLVGVAIVSLVCLGARVAVADPPASLPSPEPGFVRLPPPDPIVFDAGLRAGGAARLGQSPSLPIRRRTGPMIGVGASVAPSALFTIGLAYEHTWLGSEHGVGAAGIVDADRRIDGVWATIRLTFLRTDRVTLGVLLGPGLVWQGASANETVFAASGPPGTVQCTETEGPNLGLRAGFGTDIRVFRGLRVQLDTVFDELRLSSDPLGSCLPGVGSMAVFGVRAGLAYGFDVSRILR
jgi:hypothetical protein